LFNQILIQTISRASTFQAKQIIAQTSNKKSFPYKLS